MEIFLKILKIFLKILNIFFVFLGIVFAILIGAAIWFYITDPLELRPIIEPLFFGDQNGSINLEGIIGENPFMTGQQEQIINSMGVNFEDLPNQITPQMENCFIEKLGAGRVNEFQAGATPSLSDFLKVKSCLTQ